MLCHRSWTFPSLIIAAAALLSCGSSGAKKTPQYNPVIPTRWSEAVTNPYFPLQPGTVWEYRGETEDGIETNRVEVLTETRTINGVTATVLLDQVFLDGALIEETNDWYAQDAAGNVWYLGEDSKAVRDGHVIGSEGSWEWAVDEALPGIIMWADPTRHRNEEYRQEYYEGEAEDWGKVAAIEQTVIVPAGHYTGCIQTDDWSGLEAGTLEKKYYASGVGHVLELDADGNRIELISFTQP